MIQKKFEEINLQNPFFQTLRDDYNGFDEWFIRKSKESAFVQYDSCNKIIGFLYLKVETGKVEDVVPELYANRILKVGTFKIDAHGTKLGERFVKIIARMR